MKHEREIFCWGGEGRTFIKKEQQQKQLEEK